MDFSKLPDSQRQELKQPQKLFQEHQQQQETAAAAAAATVQQQPPPSAYDPSEFQQPYDQSYCYNYQQQHYDASYFQSYYSNAYKQQQQYTSRERQRNEGSGSLGHDPGNQLNLGMEQQYTPGGPSGLNAAAVAALSQLTQFVGSMGDGQGHFRPTGGQIPYMGGGHGRGRGRGRGRGDRHGPPFGASSSSSSSAQRIAWCELCMIDCTSKEILEQHNNGKRHKKKLQKLQDTKGVEKAGPENVPENEPDKLTKDNKVETEADDTQETKLRMKRKMRSGGRLGGAKRLRPAKVVIPLMCDLCNIKCDTQQVFGRHAAGKKHMAKLKRFQGHQAMYGPTAVQALYPPNPLSQTVAAPLEAAYQVHNLNTNPNLQAADAPLEFGTQVSTGVQ